MSAADRPPPITPSSCFNYKNRSCLFLNALRLTSLVIGILILTKTGALAQVSAGWGTTLIVLVALSVIIPCIVNRYRNSQRAAQEGAAQEGAAQEAARLAAIRIPIPTYDELVSDPSYRFSETIKPEDTVQLALSISGPGFVPHLAQCDGPSLESRQFVMDRAREFYSNHLRKGHLQFNVNIVFEKINVTWQQQGSIEVPVPEHTGQKYEFTSSFDHRQRIG